jgi:hypothetical protein
MVLWNEQLMEGVYLASGTGGVTYTLSYLSNGSLNCNYTMQVMNSASTVASGWSVVLNVTSQNATKVSVKAGTGFQAVLSGNQITVTGPDIPAGGSVKLTLGVYYQSGSTGVTVQ